MERLIQYLDELEDLFYAIALIMESVRRIARTLFALLSTLIFQVLGILLALSQPPLALAVVAIVSVGLLYRAVVGQTPVQA